MRIVSLLPSATETVAALGHEADLVGRSAECDAPATVQRLPAVMWPKAWDAGRPSVEIDDRVRKVRGAGESLYRLDIPKLTALRPDLLLTQDLCSVCSVTESEVAAACRDAGVDPRVVSLSPRTLAEVADSIEALGRELGAERAAAGLASALRPRPAPRRASPAPGVALVEWLDPPILAGLWAHEMVEAAGGRSLGPAAGEPGRRTTWPEIARLRPELLVVAPCSFSVGRTTREMSGTPVGESIDRLRPRLGTWVADEAYFSRPGPRLAEGIRALRSLIGPEAPDRPVALQRWDPPRAA